MALSLTAIAEVRNSGSDTLCSGWFNSALSGTDYTLQTSAQITCSATLSGAGGTTLTATGSPFSGLTSALPGNTFRITGQGLYEIQSVTDANNVVVDRALGTFSGGTGYVGGALATPGQAGADIAAVAATTGWGVFVKYNATAFNMTASTNVAGGSLSFAQSGTDPHWGFIQGYDTTRTRGNTDANRPTFKANASSVTCVTSNSKSNLCVDSIIFDGNSQTSSRGYNWTGGLRGLVKRCKFQNCLSSAIVAFGSILIESCEFTANTTAAVVSVTSGGLGMYGCEFYANTVNCLSLGVNDTVHTIDSCQFYGNTGASTDAIVSASSRVSVTVRNCDFYNNGRHGVNAGASAGTSQQFLIEYSVFTSNGGYGVACNAPQDGVLVSNCAFGSGGDANTSGDIQPTNVYSYNITNKISITDPYVAKGSNNFALNNTPGAGASLRSLAYLFPRGTTTGYRDIGAVQSPNNAALFAQRHMTGGLV